MNKKADLAVALAKTSGSTRRIRAIAPEEPMTDKPARRDTVPITYHAPKAVRQQLKMTAAALDRQMDDCIAEALNDWFEKHGKPAIAPRKGQG